MMKKELRKKFEELGQALMQFDHDGDVIGIHYSTTTKLLEVHVVDGEFPEHSKCDEEYVWRTCKELPWQKQVIINGVIYFDCITQEQFDREHAKESENNDNQ